MNKNGNNEGSVRKRANGTWEARYSDGRDENGHQIQSSVYGKLEKKLLKSFIQFYIKSNAVHIFSQASFCSKTGFISGFTVMQKSL